MLFNAKPCEGHSVAWQDWAPWTDAEWHYLWLRWASNATGVLLPETLGKTACLPFLFFFVIQCRGPVEDTTGDTSIQMGIPSINYA